MAAFIKLNSVYIVPVYRVYTHPTLHPPPKPLQRVCVTPLNKYVYANVKERYVLAVCDEFSYISLTAKPDST